MYVLHDDRQEVTIARYKNTMWYVWMCMDEWTENRTRRIIYEGGGVAAAPPAPPGPGRRKRTGPACAGAPAAAASPCF